MKLLAQVRMSFVSSTTPTVLAMLHRLDHALHPSSRPTASEHHGPKSATCLMAGYLFSASGSEAEWKGAGAKAERLGQEVDD